MISLFIGLVVFPMLAGLVCFVPVFKDDRKRLLFVSAVLGVNFVFVILSFMQEGTFELLHLTDVLALRFMFDGAGRFFLLLAGLMFLMVGIYSFEYMSHEQNRPRFYAFYLLTLGALNGVCLAGNYMTLYCFFELMSLLSMPLVLHSQTDESIAAAKKYLLYSVFGASLGLGGFFLFTVYGGSTNFVAGGVVSSELYHTVQLSSELLFQRNMLLIGAFLAIVGFGAKAGMMPLHAWLPTAHPVAPACASAVLSGVITKAGVLAILRVVYFLYGTGFLFDTWVQYAWLTLILLTVLVGSTLAYKEKILKKRLAYSSVSQVSYVLFGLAGMNAVSLMGALLHAAAHSMIKDVLFMSAGSIIMHGHTERADRIDGLGRKMPVTFACITVASLGLIGIPPLFGYISKWYLCTGALMNLHNFFGWLGPVVLLVSALLTAGYLFTLTINGFLKNETAESEAHEAGVLMLAPMVILCALIVLCGLFPNMVGQLIDFINIIA